METLDVNDQFGMYFNLMKIRYSVYDDSLTKLNFLTPTDKVNCFINIETVLKYLSMMRDLEKKLVVSRKFPDEMKVDLINIAGHYKDFFKGNGLDCNIFLYMTDLESETTRFQEARYNDEFRSYYLCKYNQNPKFILLGDELKRSIIPEVKTICEFIPNVYFINAKDIDGGLIPYIIGKNMPEYKNLIISGDMHDTQYSYEPSFVHHLHIRTYSKNILACTTEDYLKTISKNDKIDPELLHLFENGSFYRVILSCLGDRYRSIDGIKGIGIETIIKTLVKALDKGKITPDIHNATILSELFKTDIREQLYNNLLTIDIHNEYEMLGEGQIKGILSQMVDRSDINALQLLNQTKFRNNPLRLESLLK